MPTNLPPEYFEADQRYRAAGTTSEKIACLEEIALIRGFINRQQFDEVVGQMPDSPYKEYLIRRFAGS